jgi:myosin protein heavy chain
MEAEARDSGEQLREMAEKVFQLLERLKLAELGKTRSMEALRKKETEMIAMKKKNTRLIKESTKEGKARVKAELDKKVLADQVRALKKHNAQLSQRCREEVKLKIKEHEERAEAQEKVRTLGGRLSFLLNKMQSDEEAKIIQREEAKKMEAQIKSLAERCEELQRKVDETGESNRIITQAMRVKQEELQAASIRLEAMQKVAEEKEEDRRMEAEPRPEDDADADPEAKMAGGRLRFYVESKPTLGLSLVKGKRSKEREWLETKDCNAFLKKAQKNANVKDLLIGRIAEMYGLAMVQEEEKERLEKDIRVREDEVEHLTHKNVYYNDKLSLEEEAKRRTLLRYVHAVKAAASLGDVADQREREEVGNPGSGRLQLPEAGLTDEEVRAGCCERSQVCQSPP